MLNVEVNMSYDFSTAEMVARTSSVFSDDNFKNIFKYNAGHLSNVLYSI